MFGLGVWELFIVLLGLLALVWMPVMIFAWILRRRR